MSDFDHNLHAFRTGQVGTNSGGGGGGQSGDGLANMVESPEIIFKGIDKSAGWAAKVLGSAAPIPINFGEISAFAQFETPQGKDLASKMINEGAANLSSRGGVLYNVLVALIKDSTIKDHIAGLVGGDASGGGGAAGGGGGDAGDFLASPAFASTANNFDSFISTPMDIGGSGNFSALGGLSSPLPVDAPVVSSGRGEGAGIA